MDPQSILLLSSIVILPLLYINISRSKDVLLWERQLSQQLIYLGLIWLLPYLGAWIVYRKLDLRLIKNATQSKTDSNTIAGDVLLGVDAMVNPGQEHLRKMKEEVTVEQQESGDLKQPTLKRKRE